MGPFQWDFSRLEQPFSVHVVACSSFPTHLYLYAQIDLPLCTNFPRHVLRRMLEPGRLVLSADEASVDVTPRGFARLESRQSASL